MTTSTLPRGRDTAMIRLYAWVMIVTTGLAVAVALFATRTPPRYSATAEILIGPTITSSGNYIQPSMPTEQRVATSTEVIRAASVQLGVTAARPLQHLSVTVPVDTQVLVMTYTADTPTAALAGARTFAQTYLRVRNREAGDNAVASMVSPPSLPSEPVATNYPVILGVAVLGGLLTGFGVARAWDRVRGHIRTLDDAERSTGLDALALTPRLPSTSAVRDRDRWPGRVQLDSLAARVLGEVEASTRSTLLVTGAEPRCGSTTVAVQTALALARMGRVVILVTADDDVVARMSRDHQYGTDKTSGDLWPDARASEQDGLHLVAVAEWDGAGVAAARLTSLLPELHDRLPEALIVIDGPPAWRSAGLALCADKILLVITLGRSSRTSAAVAAQALGHRAEKMMGLVVTRPPRPLRGGLVSARAWAFHRAKRILFRLGPPSGGLAPATSRWTGLGNAPPPRIWVGPLNLEAPRSEGSVPEAEADSEADSRPAKTPAGRAPKGPPNREPTGSVLS